MVERYRLVFRGEVLEGQHRAVVKKRLGQLLKIEGEKLDGLFADKAVIIRREVDAGTAAKVQAAFKQAGARLRVMPLETAVAVSTAESAPGAPEAPSSPAPGLSLRPMAGELLDASERSAPPPVVVDVSHLTVAPPGADLGPHGAAVEPAVDIERINFEVAPPGADLGQKPREAPPAAPDTSHLRLS